MYGFERPFHEDDCYDVIGKHLQRCGLRQTPQRRIILEVFMEMKGHPSPEEIHGEIQRRGYKAGLATIYRTLKILVETGIVRKLEFGDGQGRYERHDNNGQHIHMVCKQCGRTFEAPACEVDALFEAMAEDRAFALHSHTTCLYGLCSACHSSLPEEKTLTHDTGDSHE